MKGIRGDAKIASICVYCGSGSGTDPIFTESAYALGRLLAQNGIRLVYGGGRIGIMGAIAGSVIHHGGQVTGIIPCFLVEKEKPDGTGMNLIISNDMHERKRHMFEQADAFVALPGGLGTLEELVEQLTWGQIGNHKKPVLIANIGGYWNLLLDLLQHMREEEFIRPGLEIDPLVAYRVEDILPIIRGEMEGRASVTNGDRDIRIVKHS